MQESMKKDAILERHKDRPSCEISTTLNLGGDLWPIYIKSHRKFRNSRNIWW
jgi:hypothetical protein